MDAVIQPAHVVANMLSGTFLCLYFFGATYLIKPAKGTRAVVTVGICVLAALMSLVPGLSCMGQMIPVYVAAGVAFYRCSSLKGQRFAFLFTSCWAISGISGDMLHIISLNSDISRLLVRVALAVVLLVIIRRLLRPRLTAALQLVNKGWLPLTLIPLALVLTTHFYPRLSPHLFAEHYELALSMGITWLATVGAYVAVIYFLNNAVVQQLAREDMAILHTQMASFAHQMEQYQRNYEDSRIFRHDLRHYLQMLRTCAEAGDLDEVCRQVARTECRLEEMNRAFSMLSYTGVVQLDAVFNFYRERAAEAEIDLIIRVALPEEAPLEVEGLALCLANAVENAIDACRAMPKGQERQVCVEGGSAGCMFVLTITNHHSGQVVLDPLHGYPITDVPGHGFGTRSIAAYVARCGGLLDYRVTEHSFQLRMALPLNRETQSGQ